MSRTRALLFGLVLGLLSGFSPLGPIASPTAGFAAETKDANPAVETATAEKATEPSDRLQRILAGQAPETIEDLRAMQDLVRGLVERVLPCTVGVRVGGAQGSGVIISKDGYVLTAGHVVGRPDRDVTFILHDGTRAEGKTLGANFGIDAGLMKISGDREWPHVEMGKSGDLEEGQWCLAFGHPGGYRRGRTPPVRLGRVLDNRDNAIRTDCTLVGGDSGGPLFDLEGRVIGIHSRIGASIAGNVHVPVDTYRQTWERLASAEAWGQGFGSRAGAYVGVGRDADSDRAKVGRVVEGSPAEKSGIQVGDIIVEFDGAEVKDFADLVDKVSEKRPKEKVKIVVLRGDENVSLDLVLGNWADRDR